MANLKTSTVSLPDTLSKFDKNEHPKLSLISSKKVKVLPLQTSVSEENLKDKLNSLIDLCKSINTCSSLDQVIDKTLTTLKEFLLARRVYVILSDEKVIYGTNSSKRGHRMRSVHNKTLKVLKQNKNPKRVLSYPLIYQGRSLGHIVVFLKKKEKSTSDKQTSVDKKIVQTWADHLAASVRNFQLETLANTDYLTGINVRRSFIEAFNKQNDRTGIMLTFDLDHFKAINDTLGHHTGDTVLSTIGNILKSSLRQHDLCARMGGEEFGVFLPEANINTALKIADRISTGIKQIRLEDSRIVTASFGIAQVNQACDFETVFAQADSALYKAKEAGRNCIEIY